MGGPVNIEGKGYESIIYDREMDLCVTILRWMDVRDSDRGDINCPCAVNESNLPSNLKYKSRLNWR